MIKVFIGIIYFIPIFFSCNQINHNTVEYKIVIDAITKGGLNEWYEIHDQFINNKTCKNNAHFASVYLCSPKESKDTVLVVSPCCQIKYKKNIGGALFIDENFKIGDTVMISIPPQYSIFLRKKKSVVFGILKIPIE